MIGRITRSPIALAFVAILLLIIVGSTLAVVPETKQVVIVRFGVPNRTINRIGMRSNARSASTPKRQNKSAIGELRITSHAPNLIPPNQEQ